MFDQSFVIKQSSAIKLVSIVNGQLVILFNQSPRSYVYEMTDDARKFIEEIHPDTSIGSLFNKYRSRLKLV